MMLKADSLEEQFNRMADEAGGGAEGAPSTAEEAARQRRARRSKGLVIDYADADDDLKEEMERVMAPIGAAPDSFEAIITFGTQPLIKLGKIGEDLLKIQGSFDESINVVHDAWKELHGGANSLGLEKITKNARSALKGAAAAGAAAGKGIGKAIGKAWDVLSGAAKKRSEEEKAVREIQDAIPNLLKEMKKLVDRVLGTEQGLIQLTKEVEKLGIARVDATRELGVYLGAGKEVLKRYDEEYLFEARKDWEADPTPENEMYLNRVVSRKEDFIGQLNRLEQARASSVLGARQLERILKTVEEQRKQMADLRINTQNEWRAMLSAAGFAGSSLKAAETGKMAHDFGDKVFDQTMKMIEDADQMTRSAGNRGAIDPQRLIDGLSRMEKMIEDDRNAAQERLRQLEESSKTLRGAADKLIEAADEAKKVRILESTEPKDAAEKAAATPAPAAPVTPSPAAANDDAAPAAPAAKKPRAKKGGGSAPAAP